MRDATTADLPRLARILGDWVAATDWMPKLHSRAQDLGFLGLLRQRGLLRVSGDPALGFLARQGGKIDALYLAPAARRQGLGRALLAEAMRDEPVLTLWTFQANHPARAFYSALGFEEIARGDGSGNDEALPDIRLQWRRA
jgi:ribosomal protein S18 acetylase RimI-like enzyme